MAKGPGRDQRAPMERLVRMAAYLKAHQDEPRGVPGATLASIAGFDGKDPMTQVARELKHLRLQGWEIENVAPQGEDARYRMTSVDNRFRVRLTPGQQTALRRAVLLADRGDMVRRLGLPETARPADVPEPTGADGASAAQPEDLTLVLDAVRDHRIVRFAYKGSAREVHPESVRNQNGTWYLRGVESADLDADEPLVKAFVVSRMQGVSAGDEPATVLPRIHHTGLHPMTWEIDPPVEVVLRADADYVPDVRRWLGEPVRSEADGDDVLVTYVVTHRAALRSRLNELGRRVRVVGPADVRAEVVAALAEAAGIVAGEEVAE